MAGRPRFVSGILPSLLQLIRIVRNLAEPLHRSNWTMEYDGSDEYENLTPAMVTSVMLLNDIPHVWHRLDANLEMNSYN